jgi:hypothetical protein
MLDITARNRAIKTLLEPVYGKGNVKVTGKRGTSYGWVRVEISGTQPADEERSLIIGRILDAGIELGRFEGPFGHSYEISVVFDDI